MTFLATFAFSAVLSFASALLFLPGASAISAEVSSDPLSAVEPLRYRGRYVPPAGLGTKPDPFAPGPNSPYWMRLEMTDPEGRKTFPPHLVEIASQLRYEHRNPALGLNLRVDLDMHAQPFMRVNEKIYPVDVNFRGWRKVASISADVGSRQFESAWFAAFAGQKAEISGLPPSLAVTGDSSQFRVEEAEFGPTQVSVIHADGRTTSQVNYVGRLTLRETFGSFVAREWGLTRQHSFVLAYAALIGIPATLIGGAAALIPRTFRSRRRGRSVTAPPTARPVPMTPPRRSRKRRKKRR